MQTAPRKLRFLNRLAVIPRRRQHLAFVVDYEQQRAPAVQEGAVANVQRWFANVLKRLPRSNKNELINRKCRAAILHGLTFDSVWALVGCR
jgi:predicted SnoaL-like aldol condensation-catalyzing enzyme